jgi:hypothetical protein
VFRRLRGFSRSGGEFASDPVPHEPHIRASTANVGENDANREITAQVGAARQIKKSRVRHCSQSSAQSGGIGGGFLVLGLSGLAVLAYLEADLSPSLRSRLEYVRSSFSEVMKLNPLSSLKNFTVPVAISVPFQSLACVRAKQTL